MVAFTRLVIFAGRAPLVPLIAYIALHPLKVDPLQAGREIPRESGKKWFVARSGIQHETAHHVEESKGMGKINQT